MVLVVACNAAEKPPVESAARPPAPLPTHSNPASEVADAAPPHAARPVEGGVPRFDAYAWASARGIDPAAEKITIEGACRAVTLGDPPRDALWCEGGIPVFQTTGGESVFPLVVLDVDQGHLRQLLRAPLYAGALDFDTIYVRLSATLAADGRSIAVSERPEQTCAKARADAKKLISSPVDAPGLRDWLTAIDHACAGVAHYVWRGGRFVKSR